MSEISKCNRCGAPLPPDSPEGLCPRCLVALNLATQTEITGETQAAKPSPAPPLPVEEVAKLFPQLEILECLGRGGMGAVYKARQPRLDRLVALKILSPEKQGSQKFAERFEHEARALAKLHHPNIVTVYDFGEAQGNFYLLMEFVDGLTLRQLLQARKLSPAEALAIVPKICEALQYAHDQGIVHRDIKPENILLDKIGRVKIADFGIAKILGDGGRDNLSAEQVIGTPHYMSPEQIEKPQTVDHRADIYSLGVVFYEMLTGELPLGKFQPPSHKVHIDVRLDEVVLRALEKEPERRYQQASEVKTRVETIANSQGGPAANAGATPNPSKGRDYRSKQTIFGLPLVHVAWGVDPVTHRPRVANGLFAVGSNAEGLCAVGLKAKGLIAVGIEAYGLGATGLIAGGIFPVGLLAFGVFPVGLIAYGIMSVGLLAIALFQAVGLVSLGNHSVGPMHFGINAPGFFLLGLPIVAIWFLRMIFSTIKRAWPSARQPAAAATPLTDRFRRTAIVVAAWIAIIGSVLIFMLVRNHITTPTVVTLSEAAFLQKFESNQISHATYNPSVSGSPITITGKYLETGKDGKQTEVPFIAPNVVLTRTMENKLLASDKIKVDVPNPMLSEIGYQLLFFVGLSFVGMIFVPGIIIYAVRRAVEKTPAHSAPPLIQKPDRFWRWFAVTVLALIAIPFLISILGLLAAIAIPNFVRARQHAMALHEQQVAANSFSIGQTWFPRGDSIEITSVERNGNQMTVKGHYNLVSHDSALLALYITSTNQSGSGFAGDAQQSMQISRGNGDFELVHFHVFPGLPHVSMYADGHSFAALYFGNKEEAAEESKARWITNTPPASAETQSFSIGQVWFPEGDSIEITSVERNGNQMTVKGHYNLVSHDNALLALCITTTNGLGFPEPEPKSTNISKGSGDFELIRSHVFPGLPHVSMYANGPPFASLYFGNKKEAAEESRAPWITNRTASAEIRFPVVTTDQVIVEDLALHILVAVRDKDDSTLKELATDERVEGWRDALPWFAVEMREKFRQFTGKPFDMQVAESQVRGDEALVKCTGAKSVYLVLFFVKTDDGWKNCYLHNAPLSKPLDDFWSQFPAQSNSASAETWSPALAPGEKPDLQKIRDEVKTLMEQYRYEEALQRQIWYFNHALQYGEVNPIRLSFGIMNWAKLGRRYPRAKQALIEIRDRDVREFSEGRGYAELFLEISSLNQELQDDGATLALFEAIYKQDKQLAGQCYDFAQDLLMQRGEYELCLNTLGDPQTRFESFRRSFEMQRESQQRMEEIRGKYSVQVPTRSPGSAFTPPDLGQMATNNYVGQVCKLVEILVATGHSADAETIQKQAVAVLDDPWLKSAVDDAKEKIRQIVSTPGTNTATNATSAAQAWLALIDAGNYSESWNGASTFFQGAVTEAAWENSMNTFRKTLGDLVSRKLISAQQMTEMPGAPDGQYVLMQFETSFTNKKSAIETVTFMLEKDGQWKSSGYYIK